jgi:adenosylcobinamide-phosphate synthase
MPHPIKLFGQAIANLEKCTNKGSNKVFMGGLMSIFFIASTFFTFILIKRLTAFNVYVEIIIGSIFVFYGLANRTLINEVLKVNKQLTNNGIEAGRKQLSYIVGRDTHNLDEQAIRKASLETLAENLSDGVIAPLFYLFLGGFPLMLTYKMVNTLDSMIGYKSERYKDFGMIAAKIDDVFNFIPAKITAILIAVVSLKAKSFSFIFKYGNKHSSPNAGFPEAAMAGALDCQFGGSSEYYGEIIDKPYIGNNSRNLNLKDVKYACGLNIKASVLFLVIGISILNFFLHY